jgi:hypothetical protein
VARSSGQRSFLAYSLNAVMACEALCIGRELFYHNRANGTRTTCCTRTRQSRAPYRPPARCAPCGSGRPYTTNKSECEFSDRNKGRIQRSRYHRLAGAKIWHIPSTSAIDPRAQQADRCNESFPTTARRGRRARLPGRNGMPGHGQGAQH